jgi:hypothetical protein
LSVIASVWRWLHPLHSTAPAIFQCSPAPRQHCCTDKQVHCCACCRANTHTQPWCVDALLHLHAQQPTHHRMPTA